MSNRTASLTRDTRETQVSVTIDLDGTGQYSVDTPNGMFNHLIEQLARHGLMDITVSAKGDTSPGWQSGGGRRNSPGTGFHQAIGEGRGIVRMGHIMVPLDETLALVAVDVGGRPYAVIKTPFQDSHIGDLPSDLVRHFLEVFALEGRLNLHAEILYGANEHHKAEALFKALARAIRQAVAIDPRIAGDVPSTKGTISD